MLIFADQIRTIIKKVSFYDLEILEIHQKINKNKIIMQYQTHQEFANKNSLTEMNCQIRKMEIPHNQTTQNKHYYKNKK